MDILEIAKKGDAICKVDGWFDGEGNSITKEQAMEIGDIRFDNTDQKMCNRCQGMKTLLMFGETVDPMDWIYHGFAGDIGCIC